MLNSTVNMEIDLLSRVLRAIIIYGTSKHNKIKSRKKRKQVIKFKPDSITSTQLQTFKPIEYTIDDAFYR